MKSFLLIFILSALLGYVIIKSTHTHYETITNFVFSTGKAPGPDLRPNEWEYIKKTYPYYAADSDVYIRAIEKANQLKKETIAARLSKGLANVQWEFAGPTNIGGRVVDLEFDPTNPSII